MKEKNVIETKKASVFVLSEKFTKMKLFGVVFAFLSAVVAGKINGLEKEGWIFNIILLLGYLDEKIVKMF